MSRSGVVEWRQREVVATIAAEVEARMADAAKLVEMDARHRLMRVRDPEYGRKYRAILALYRLTSIVKRTGMVVEGLIGIPAGEKGTDYGYWIERGTRHDPAHPWLAPALWENLTDIKALLEDG